MIIAVTAVDHPTCDDWVMEHARDEAATLGIELPPYQGREVDVYGPAVADYLHCHLFCEASDLPKPEVHE